MDLELTPWFSQWDYPHRTGVYEVRGKSGANKKVRFFSYYDIESRKWGLVSYTVRGAEGMRNKPSNSQYKYWRGVYRPGYDSLIGGPRHE